MSFDSYQGRMLFRITFTHVEVTHFLFPVSVGRVNLDLLRVTSNIHIQGPKDSTIHLTIFFDFIFLYIFLFFS